MHCSEIQVSCYYKGKVIRPVKWCPKSIVGLNQNYTRMHFSSFQYFRFSYCHVLAREKKYIDKKGYICFVGVSLFHICNKFQIPTLQICFSSIHSAIDCIFSDFYLTHISKLISCCQHSSQEEFGFEHFAQRNTHGARDGNLVSAQKKVLLYLLL